MKVKVMYYYCIRMYSNKMIMIDVRPNGRKLGRPDLQGASEVYIFDATRGIM
jgi:hypothetical protein